MADAAPSSGEVAHGRASSGRMVMQLTAGLLVGGSNPDRASMAPPPPPTDGRPGFQPPTENFASAALQFDRRWSDSNTPPHCWEPSERKLLTPPVPPKKCYPVLGDRGLRIKKSIGGMVLLGKIMILQGVGHPISCLGVCYTNDPKKGGYTTPTPALDLTTSLRGDFHLHPPCMVTCG